MLVKALAGLSAALMLTATAYAADPTPLTIYHSWSTPSEMAALDVMRDRIDLIPVRKEAQDLLVQREKLQRHVSALEFF